MGYALFLWIDMEIVERKAYMCKETNFELKRGELAARQLALHLMAMGGASRADIQVEGEEGHHYVVSIAEKPVLVPRGTPAEWADSKFGSERGKDWEYFEEGPESVDLEARALKFKEFMDQASKQHGYARQDIDAAVYGDALLLLDNWEPK